MKKYKIAAVLQMILGIIELFGFLSIIPLMLFEDKSSEMTKYVSFIVPYLQENLNLMLIISVIFGTMRIISAVGLFKNRMWGFVLAIINCTITMALMIFMLPSGIMDGILSCSALVILLVEYFGKKTII